MSGHLVSINENMVNSVENLYGTYSNYSNDDMPLKPHDECNYLSDL